jgi:hypothetical protein
MPIDRERFDRPVKMCRDLLVDVVSRLLGVPLIGQSANPSSISVGALVTAAGELHRARSSLASSEQTPGQHLTPPARRSAASTERSPRQRRRLAPGHGVTWRASCGHRAATSSQPSDT